MIDHKLVESKRYFINSFYLYLSHFSDYLLSFLTLPFIARAIGPEELGLVGFTQLYGALILLIMEFGSSLMAVREVVKKKGNITFLRSFVSEIISFKIMLIPLVFLISIITYSFIPVYNDSYHYLFIATLGSILQGLAPTWYFEGLEKMKLLAISKTFFRLISFIAIILFVNSSSDGWMVIGINSICSFFVFCLLFVKMKNEIKSFSLSTLNNIGKIWVKSKKSFSITITPVIFQNISIAMLSLFVSPAQFGYFFGSSKIHLAFNNLYGPISQAFYPRINALEQNNPTLAKKSIIKYLLTLFLIGIFFCLLIITFSQEIIVLLLGSNFLPGKQSLQTFAFILPLTAISNALGRQWLMVKGKESQYAKIQIIGSIASIIFLLIFIERFGIITMPLSLIFFEVTSIILITIYLMKKCI